jgi:hypothetical protein
MGLLYKYLKQFTIIAGLMFCTNSIVVAQQKPFKINKWNRSFAQAAARANIAFFVPEGFKEITDRSEASPFDYGITLSEQNFEIWFKISPQKENSSDSIYLDMGKNEAKALGGENGYFMRSLPGEILEEYNADAGKTYFLSLPDSPVTKHYKFALLITLQKNHRGIVMAAGLTNDKGPDFFKNLNRARYCLKFKG